MVRSSDGALARYTRDLTADARAGRLDAVRCREPEIDRVVDVLLRRDKNNPVLVGDAGVGKTAIAEGLAQRLAAGTVPLSLRGLRLLALDHVALLAGAMYRGQYEERLQGVVEETKRAGDVALFIDELHNLVGQGTAIGVAMDAANMLKPALARGEFRVVGATTREEYDRWIRSDAALERRFQPVLVRELTGATCWPGWAGRRRRGPSWSGRRRWRGTRRRRRPWSGGRPRSDTCRCHGILHDQRQSAWPAGGCGQLPR
jgi:ATP-dependent Clp protease ATP-binding subunit ClpA